MTNTDEGSLTVDLCLRSSVTGVIEARQSAVLDRVEQLKRAGVVADVRVHYWGSQVTAPADGTRNDSGCPEIVTELYESLDDPDGSLSPFFRKRRPDPDRRTVLFLPVVCLVVRRDGRIVDVYPSTRGDDQETVQDGLAALEGRAESGTVQ